MIEDFENDDPDLFFVLVLIAIILALTIVTGIGWLMIIIFKLIV